MVAACVVAVVLAVVDTACILEGAWPRQPPLGTVQQNTVTLWFIVVRNTGQFVTALQIVAMYAAGYGSADGDEPCMHYNAAGQRKHAQVVLLSLAHS